MKHPQPDHHHAIIWPKSSVTNSTTDEEGYVIGWILHDNNFRCNENPIQYITFICICVIPFHLYERNVIEQTLCSFQQKQTCQCFKDLKIIAYYQNSLEERLHDDKKSEKLPILHKMASTSGPVFHKSHCPYNRQSLIWYDRLQKLEHYNHHSKQIMCQRLDSKLVNNDTHQSFHTTLLRISEAENIIDWFQKFMKNEKKNENQNLPISAVGSDPNMEKNKNGMVDVVTNPIQCKKERTNSNDKSNACQNNHMDHRKRYNMIFHLLHKISTKTISIWTKISKRLEGSSFIIQHWKHYRHLMIAIHENTTSYEKKYDNHIYQGGNTSSATRIHCPLLICISYFITWTHEERCFKNIVCNQHPYLHLQEQTNTNFTPKNCHSKWSRKIKNFQFHRFQISQTQLEESNIFAKCLLDGILGCVFGVILYHHAEWTQNHVLEKVGRFFHEILLIRNVKWLDTVPVGFKLNKPLTKDMTRELLQLVRLYELIVLNYIFPRDMHLIAIQIFALISVTFGFTFSLAILMDMVQIFTVHTSVMMTRFFQFIYYWQLQLFNSLWHLFRGKKIDVLRSRRSDTLEYDSIQLLLGMILFMICLFLFTTVWVYYFFFTVLNLFVEGVLIFGLWSCYFCVLNFPLGKLLVRLLEPKRFCEQVHFLRTDDDVTAPRNKDGVSIFEIHLQLQSIPSVVFEDYSPAGKHFVKKIPNFLAEIVRGMPRSLAKTCLEIGKTKIIRRNRI